MDEESSADRRSPVGEPVVRSDPAVTGDRAAEAVGFDPDDPDSVAEAAETVRRFAAGDVGDGDNVLMLRGAAACAALVRGVGSYKTAAKRAGDEVSVSFIRKWARVHDLPEAIRRQVARGYITPSAAKHVARLGGTDRYLLAWAAIDGEMTVREVRSVASAVNDGADIERAVREVGIDLGRIQVDLPLETYVELRRRAAMRNVNPGTIISDALGDHFATSSLNGRGDPSS